MGTTDDDNATRDPTNVSRRRVLTVGALGVAGLVAAVGAAASIFPTSFCTSEEGLPMSIQEFLRKARHPHPNGDQLRSSLPVEAAVPSLGGATAWLNSPPLAAADLRGHVVLFDFCTYTCVNWLRTLPYVRAWADTYRDHGLIVIGVHTPEFPFEHDLDNIRRALAEMQVTYPIAVDNDYGVWNAFMNHYWPAVYLADAEGRIRYHHYGEGAYQESEAAIKQLLTEAGQGDIGRAFVSPNARGLEVAADWENVRSPESYLGYEQGENFASPGGLAPDERRVYALPQRLRLNEWAVAGEGTVGAGATVLHAAGGRIAYRFHARDVNLVMSPAMRDTAVRFQVRVDGQPPGDAHGGDVDADGNGVVREQRTYQLIRQPGQIAERTFEIAFLDAGAAAYDFTFG
jgi:thiol-disulfide isomerase/thioredoxin